MAFAVWVKQSGQGCDYMISCGEKLIDLAAGTREEALVEAKRVLMEDYGMTVGSDREAEKVMVVEIIEDIDPGELTEEEEEEDEETKRSRALYYSLKKRFG